MMGDMSADGSWRDNDGIAGAADGHEAIEVGNGTGWHPYFHKLGVEDLCTKLRADHFNFFNGLKTHFIFVSGVAQGGA